MTDVVVPFPNRADLKANPAEGYADISRKVCRIVQEHHPEPQAARLTVRASALAATHFMTRREVAEGLRSLADEVENMR